jgi:hypothetical protein
MTSPVKKERPGQWTINLWVQDTRTKAVPHTERLMDTLQKEVSCTQAERAEQAVNWAANSPLPLAPSFDNPETVLKLLK